MGLSNTNFRQYRPEKKNSTVKVAAGQLFFFNVIE